MSQNKDSKSRREQIMNSGKTLPGDPARADAEENEDFDAGDSGNFDLSTADHQAGDPLRREEINENTDELEGDVARGDDDEAVDATGKTARTDRKHASAKR